MEAAEPPPHLPLEAGVPTDEELAPCATCGRTFVISSLQRHSAVCKKNSAPSRGKFDSSRQRLHGTGLEPYKPPPPVKGRPRSRSVPGECLYLRFDAFCRNCRGGSGLVALLRTGAKVNDVLLLHFIIYVGAAAAMVFLVSHSNAVAFLLHFN
jgi:hypothetical protein